MSENKSEIKLEVTLDENKVPESIDWKASEKDFGKSNAALISIWDHDQQQTLKLDLWTKSMMHEEMSLFFYQTMITMADTYQRATSNEQMAKDIKDFAYYFGKKTSVIVDKK